LFEADATLGRNFIGTFLAGVIDFSDETPAKV
jgi:hypothetical protein